MKFILIVSALFFSASSFAAIDLDWLQGNWLGCEEGYLQEKAITSSLGGEVDGALKVLQGDRIVTQDYMKLKPDAVGSTTATLTFFTGTAVERTASCNLAGTSFTCVTDDGSFEVDVSISRGNSTAQDVLHFAQKYGGGTHPFDMNRAGQIVPTCN